MFPPYVSFIIFSVQACSVVELYGYLDMETRDWIDGLFSNIFREMNKPIEREVCEGNGCKGLIRFICL